MKYALFALPLLLLVAFRQPVDYDKLFVAVCMVESHNNPNAISTYKGKTYVGVAQIGPSALDELKRLYPYYKNTKLTDFKDPVLSKRAFVDLLSAYNPSDMEDAARIWNGGPKGPSKSSTKKYWKKVQNEM